jgi:cytochrome c-type biogenesis protein
MPESVPLVTAFLAGLLSFFSPCVLPLVPIYLGYMSGTAATSLGSTNRARLMIHAAFFVVGFGMIFVLLGAVAGLLGSLIMRALPIIVRIGGLVLILFGLSLSGLVRIPLLQMDKHLNMDSRRAKGYWRSLLVGIVFAAGWTPCIGPVLASILFLAANSQTAFSGALLLSVYTLGLGLPFLAAGGLINLAIPLIRKLGKWTRIFNYIGGGSLIVMGFLLVTGLFNQISSWLNAFAAGH